MLPVTIAINVLVIALLNRLLEEHCVLFQRRGLLRRRKPILCKLRVGMGPDNWLLWLGFLAENLGHYFCLVLVGNCARLRIACRDPFGALMLALDLIS